MSSIIYSRIEERHLPLLREFCRVNWGGEHPLIHNREMFDRYYRSDSGINMVIAYIPDGGSIDIQGVCGYIPTNSSACPDVFLSYILSKKGLKFSISLRLIEYIQEITGAKTVNCNNIRRNTAGIYEFLGYTVADMQHYYRLNPDIPLFSLCRVVTRKVTGIRSKQIEAYAADVADIESFPFERYTENRPFKDREYTLRRYLTYPFHSYTIMRLHDEMNEALLVLRRIQYNDSCMLRVADFIGSRELIRESGYILDSLMKENNAEFIDWYAYGADESEMEYAGFSLCSEEQSEIVPIYLSPPVMENVTVTVFVSDPAGFMMFRADGDQDRPNLG